MAAYRDLVARAVPDAAYSISEYPGHEYELTDRALEDGAELIVAVGGDGTWSHVADRILASGRDDVLLGLLPSGTGNDFGRNLGLSYSDPTAAVGRLTHGSVRPVDAGRILTPSRPAEVGKTDGDGLRVRHFLNVVGVGFDVAVVDAAAGARFLRGELLYKTTALKQLFRFQGLPVGLAAEGEPPPPVNHLMITITNGTWFGGGFPIAPGAGVEDGRLHACVIRDATPFRRMSLFSRAGKGRHVDQPEVERLESPGFRLGFDGPPRFEIDGDLFVAEEEELTLEARPGALKILA